MAGVWNPTSSGRRGMVNVGTAHISRGTDTVRLLEADPELGAGNVLSRLVAHGAPLDGPGMAFDVEVDGIPAGDQQARSRREVR